MKSSGLNKEEMERLATVKETDGAEDQRRLIMQVMALQEIVLWSEGLTKSICTSINKGTDVIAANDEMFADEEPIEFQLGPYANVDDTRLANIDLKPECDIGVYPDFVVRLVVPVLRRNSDLLRIWTRLFWPG